MYFGNDPVRHTRPLPYTGSPLRLLANEAVILISHATGLPKIIQPWIHNSGSLDELYPFSLSNIRSILFHVFITVLQLSGIAMTISLLASPAFFLIGFLTFFLWVNKKLCSIFNGPELRQKSDVDLTEFKKHDDEHWVFINGVSVG